MEDEGPRLGAAEAAVEADELLERAALVERRVVEAADHDVGDVREAVGALEVQRSRRREGRERVSALDLTAVQVARAVAAEDDRAALGRAHEQPADVLVRAQRSDE